MTHEQRVIREIARQLGLNESTITPDSTFQDLYIDSLDLMEMTMALEDEFDRKIDDAAVFAWRTVGDVIEALR